MSRLNRSSAGAKPEDVAPPIRILIRTALAIIEPVPDLRRHLWLATSRHHFELGSRYGVRSPLTLDPHGQIKNGKLFVDVGVLPRIVAELVRSGRQYTIVDETPPRERVVVDERILAKMSPEESAFLGAIMANHRGLVHAPRLNQRIALIVAAAGALPKARIAVGVASRALAKLVHKLISPQLNEPVALYHKHTIAYSSARLQVTTAGSLHPWDSDLVFFVQVEDSLIQLFRPTLGELNQGQRAFAFAGRGPNLGTRERLFVERVFGPTIHSVGNPADRPAGVDLLMADVGSDLYSGPATSLEQKRMAVWQNSRRNAAIAKIARAMADGRVEDVWPHGILLDQDALEERARAGGRVAILVESPEHGRALALLLPNWSLLERVPVRPPSFEGAGDEAELPQRSLVTLARAAQLNELDIDVLIRADGNPWPLALRGFPPQAGPEARRVFLIDFADAAADEVVREHSHRRLAAYGEHEETVTGNDFWSALR
jgi:hypothetical protein